MKSKILTLLFLALNTMFLANCNNQTNNSTTSLESLLSEKDSVDIFDSETLSSSDINESLDSFSNSELSESSNDLQDILDNKITPLSSISDVTSEVGTNSYEMYAEYDDTYTFNCAKASRIAVFCNDEEIVSGSTSLTLKATKNEKYRVEVTSTANKKFLLNVTPSENKIRLPYDILPPVDTSTIDTSTSNETTIKSATVNYQKRPGGTYIYSNNPELIPNDSVGDAFISNENITGEVYFTFEHANYSSKPIYLGYQLLNETNHDIYVTVLNVGYVAGGTWFGQRAWYDFYNTKFDLPNDYFTSTGAISSKYSSFDYAYEDYTPRIFQPTTYRIPANKYFYVIGGTSKDSYNNINVDNTANNALQVNRCANGNVKFKVTNGSVKATFYAYSDVSQVQANPKPRGYRLGGYAAQYMGIANHHGVTDNQMMWEFNDNNKNGYLPINYSNIYDDFIFGTKNPYDVYNNKLYYHDNETSWMTHLNPQNNNVAVGMDLVEFNCIDENGRNVVIDNYHADGSGKPANTANWMFEYQDHFTFINRGDEDRTIIINLKDHGTLAVLLRDNKGKVIEAKYTTGLAEKLNSYEYVLTIKAHSYQQVTLDYLLVACSYGSVTHSLYLSH